MITTKTCNTCEHFPNDHHCVGCVWDQDKGENSKWELKINPMVIERAVLDKIRDEIEESITDYILDEEDTNTATRMGDVMTKVFQIIDKYRNEVNE